MTVQTLTKGSSSGILIFMDIDHFQEVIPNIEKNLNYTFQDRSLLLQAFIHSSFVNEHRNLPIISNERLEFLGDAVLQLVVSKYLFTTFPHISEGDLSSLRSRLVNAASCQKYLDHLSLASFLLLGKGEQHSFGKGRQSILANLFEALIGAIYLDSGQEKAYQFFFMHFQDFVHKMTTLPIQDAKTRLQHHCQKIFYTSPTYTVVAEEGVQHQKIFTVTVSICGEVKGQGRGFSKKEAEQKAAEEALNLFEML